MSREYTAVMGNVTITSTNSLVVLAPSSTNLGTFEIMRAWASQAGSVTSAQTQIRLVTAYNQATANQPVGTSGTSAATKGFNDPASKIAGSTVAGPSGAITFNCTSEGTGANKLNPLYADSFNALNGWLWVPTPPETHMIGTYASSQCYCLFVPVTPGSLTNWNAGLSYRELG